jgi:zinc D-Ala-D-Ala carboxypeptidase
MISEHFSVAETQHSGYAVSHGIPNIPPLELECAVKHTADAMERVRAALGNKAIRITSWYRSPVVNRAVGSKPTSQHLKGEAVDFTCPTYGTPLDICRQLVKLQDLIRFDQLILEPSWVHISFTLSNAKPRGQVLSLLKSGQYSQGLTDREGNKL